MKQFTDEQIATIREALERALMAHNQMMVDADFPTGSPRIENALAILDAEPSPGQESGEALRDSLKQLPRARLYDGVFPEGFPPSWEGRPAILILADDLDTLLAHEAPKDGSAKEGGR